MTAAIIGLVSLICGFIIRWVYKSWDAEAKKTPLERHKDELSKIETNFAKGDDKAISVDILEQLDDLRRVHTIQSPRQQQSNNKAEQGPKL